MPSECPIASNVKIRLTDEDPNPVCPIYLDKFVGNKGAMVPKVMKKNPEFTEIRKEYLDFLSTLDIKWREDSNEII